MDLIPEVVPVSDLRTGLNALLERIEDGPVLLTQHGRSAAVLLGPKRYNELIEELEDLSLALDGVEALSEPGSLTEFRQYLAERGDRVHAPSDQ